MKKDLKSWKLIYEGAEYACDVPCSYYSVLLENEIIKDPYYRDQEKLIESRYGDNCRFESTVTVDASFLSKKKQELVFEGLDTLCTVYLNGAPIGKTDNMHRTWRFDVTGILQEGENRLAVQISSAVSYFQERNRLHPMRGNGDTIPGFAHLRKAFYMMGWDWGPTLPDMGIWRPVSLVSYDARIADVEIRQKHLADGSVVLSCAAEIEGGEGLDIEICAEAPDGTLYSGKWVDGRYEIAIADPALWWPNGYGEQPLYQVKVRLLKEKNEIDTVQKTIGLRTITVSQEKDGWGKEFCFLVNGIKIFAMGANYIPEENLLPRRSREKTERLLGRCAAANFNTVRVWGGGFYPEDWFYDLCDRYGLIVWQDFMFACNLVWLTDDFERTVKAEFVDNLKRIRHHASLGLLCGNNENEEFLVAYMRSSGMELERADYLRLYCHIIPDICDKLAPDTFYWSSSPSSATPLTNPGDDSVGDRHIWTVWSGLKSIDTYKTYFPRFCSEFGFESLPDYETVKSFTLPEDRNLFSEVMERHQKHKNGNGKLMFYIAQYYQYPTDFEKVIYATQLMQARAIKTLVEHLRRNRGRCMGSTYWQLNDCWPVASWSAIDYYGRPKALYHASKRFFAPVLLSADVGDRSVSIHVSSEKKQSFEGVVRWSWKDGDLRTRHAGVVSLTVPALSAEKVVTIAREELCDARHCFLEYELTDASGNLISGGTSLLVKPKQFVFPKAELRYEVEQIGQGCFLVRVSANAFARKVKIALRDLEMTDISLQYFDITSDQPVSLTLSVQDQTLEASDIEAAIYALTEADLA